MLHSHLFEIIVKISVFGNEPRSFGAIRGCWDTFGRSHSRHTAYEESISRIEQLDFAEFGVAATP
jgi:hypothetical protein